MMMMMMMVRNSYLHVSHCSCDCVLSALIQRRLCRDAEVRQGDERARVLGAHKVDGDVRRVLGGTQVWGEERMEREIHRDRVSE